ncbi:hypothetical protein [Salinimicrobium flavum]|uniref:Uncharacterized protein n=1 Tax=Salinimicrobium flavum TaxID=1737065 RepID=A0ABW5IZ68_9FLAO
MQRRETRQARISLRVVVLPTFAKSGIGEGELQFANTVQLSNNNTIVPGTGHYNALNSQRKSKKPKAHLTDGPF